MERRNHYGEQMSVGHTPQAHGYQGDTLIIAQNFEYDRGGRESKWRYHGISSY